MNSEPLTLREIIIEKWSRVLDFIEYGFAKHWLDRTFGYQEYWGEYIQELITQQSLDKGDSK